jgi:hypothetical protein
VAQAVRQLGPGAEPWTEFVATAAALYGCGWLWSYWMDVGRLLGSSGDLSLGLSGCA